MHEEELVLRTIAEMQKHSRLTAEIVQALHIQNLHLQSLLCALIDTHPQPDDLLEKFEAQLARSVAKAQLEAPETVMAQGAAWRQRILERIRSR